MFDETKTSKIKCFFNKTTIIMYFFLGFNKKKYEFKKNICESAILKKKDIFEVFDDLWKKIIISYDNYFDIKNNQNILKLNKKIINKNSKINEHINWLSKTALIEHEKKY